MDDVDSVWLGLFLEGEMPATHSPVVQGWALFRVEESM